MGLGTLGEVAGQPFQAEAAAPGVDRAGDAGLLQDLKLGVARDPGREVSRQC